ncbi:hypothetical protein CERZMDRAFT_99700 [Cercospora zeae-maydis SCOH1-5]|uniref:F-box domain-containing protein n=1 Tax=Cercospora zeae-maydis SCOH1-5 TaxID=717836 RepID=A0A6A6FA51_9PEZI|nr:hypothetical protein CERZMDRAFT_99700 [Cercospora zeae-maydis SCOH1-5]
MSSLGSQRSFPTRQDRTNGSKRLTSLPPNILHRILRLLSASRADISSCRLTCRSLQWHSTPHLLTHVVLAPRLDAIHRLHWVLCSWPFLSSITTLVYVDSPHSSADFSEYLGVLHRKDWQELRKDDQEFWSTLALYSDFKDLDPLMLLAISKEERTYCTPLMYNDYVQALRNNMLIALLRKLPKLQHLHYLGHRAAVDLGLLDTDESLAHMGQDDPTQGGTLGHLVRSLGQHGKSDILSFAFGDTDPRPDETNPVGRSARHQRTVTASSNSSLPLHILNQISDWEAPEFSIVTRTLRQLCLSLALVSAPARWLTSPSLLSLLRGAALNLTHLLLNADDSLRENDADLCPDCLGLLDFRIILMHLTFPHLVHLDLRGWSYTQAEMQHFLSHHAPSLRNLTLIHNSMRKGDFTSFVRFLGGLQSLVKIEVQSSCDSFRKG